MSDPVRKELSWLASEVGTVLMLITDADERELLQEHFERELNGELHAAFGGPARPQPVLVRPSVPLVPPIDLAAARAARLGAVSASV